MTTRAPFACSRLPLTFALFLFACGPGNCIGNCLAVDPPVAAERSAHTLAEPEVPTAQVEPAPGAVGTTRSVLPATTLASLPLPPGTEELPAREGGRSFVVEAELNDTMRFYEEQMREDGWTPSAPPVRTGENALLRYARGDEQATVTLTEVDDGLMGQLWDH